MLVALIMMSVLEVLLLGFIIQELRGVREDIELIKKEGIETNVVVRLSRGDLRDRVVMYLLGDPRK